MNDRINYTKKQNIQSLITEYLKESEEDDILNLCYPGESDGSVKKNSRIQHLVHTSPLLVIQAVPLAQATPGTDPIFDQLVDDNTVELQLENEIFINDKTYILYGIIYKPNSGHYTSCVRHIGTNNWYYCDDATKPVEIRGRIPECYRNKIVMLWYYEKSVENIGF